MIQAKEFYEFLKESGVTFYTGVPDSLLKDFCGYVADHANPEDHHISTNEGSALALAVGYHLGTNKISLVYLQNSGIGNLINPLLSLADKEVYAIPMIMMIGWRGEPGVKDEPQHIKQGKCTIELLESMQITYSILSEDSSNYQEIITNALTDAENNQHPVALVIKKNTFEPYKYNSQKHGNYDLERETALKTILDHIEKDGIIVSTTGKLSRELFELREARREGHSREFLTVGSMGHASQIAYGIALKNPNRPVYCFDGDGAVLMHLGASAMIGHSNCSNYKHILFNNGSHDSVGGQETLGSKLQFGQIFKGLGYNSYFLADSNEGLFDAFKNCMASSGPTLLEIKIKKGARKDLGRPTTTPLENKLNFKQFINK